RGAGKDACGPLPLPRGRAPRSAAAGPRGGFPGGGDAPGQSICRADAPGCLPGRPARSQRGGADNTNNNSNSNSNSNSNNKSNSNSNNKSNNNSNKSNSSHTNSNNSSQCWRPRGRRGRASCIYLGGLRRRPSLRDRGGSSLQAGCE
ncbi:unnamed protein product, partial [Polarella glacialis]